MGRALQTWAKISRQGRAVSICIYCGQDHVAGLRICPRTGKNLGNGAQASQKTLFGVAPPSAPLAAASRKLTPLAVSLPPPNPISKGSPSLALSKTMFGMASPKPARNIPAPAPPPVPRLPTEQEARDNPELVISLDVTPPAGYPVKTTPAPRAASPPAMKVGEPPVDLPPPTYLAAPMASPPEAPSGEHPRVDSPVDLPVVGNGARFVLPQPDQETARQTPRESSRIVRDARMVFGLVGWATGNYLRNLQPFFLLAILLVLPASMVESCLLAAAMPSAEPTLLGKGSATVDFSARKAELAVRIQQSQASGQIDPKATAELAALTSVETAAVPLAKAQDHEGSGWLRARLAALIQGFLMFGLALPLALAALALATVDQEARIALPGLADVWPILLARAELFWVALLPAALLVALGHALFVLPGLALSVLFIFLPHVVLFEKRRGRAALERSLELVKTDARRAVLAFLLFGLAGVAAAMLAELLFPPSGSRAVVFVHFLFADLLAAMLLPVPAMVLARLYLDIRARTGGVAERLSRAARS